LESFAKTLRGTRKCQCAEGARVAIRAVRRDGMDVVKKQEKDKALSEDEASRIEVEIQKVTDSYIQKIDTMATHKEKDIVSL
jgi:ribosome recycling factor